MKKSAFALLVTSLMTTPFLMGMAAVGVKQFSRTINEETLKNIKPCDTTEAEIVKLLRKPTDDYTAAQGDYKVYTYYGFTSRGGTEKQKLDILLNKENIVVGHRLNYEGTDPIKDECLG